MCSETYTCSLNLIDMLNSCVNKWTLSCLMMRVFSSEPFGWLQMQPYIPSFFAPSGLAVVKNYVPSQCENSSEAIKPTVARRCCTIKTLGEMSKNHVFSQKNSSEVIHYFHYRSSLHITKSTIKTGSNHFTENQRIFADCPASNIRRRHHNKLISVCRQFPIPIPTQTNDNGCWTPR